MNSRYAVGKFLRYCGAG